MTKLQDKKSDKIRVGDIRFVSALQHSYVYLVLERPKRKYVSDPSITVIIYSKSSPGKKIEQWALSDSCLLQDRLVVSGE